MRREALIKERFRERDSGREGGGEGGDEMQQELVPSPGWLSQESRSSLPVSAPLLCLNAGQTAVCLHADTMGCSPASHIHLDPLV